MAKNGNGGGCGCLGLIVFALVLWALVFGVTVGGRHYGLSCSTERGVEIQWDEPEPAEAPVETPK